MKPELELNAKYPEMTKERLAEIVLQQSSLIQKMQERIYEVEQEITRLKAVNSNANSSLIQPAHVVSANRPQTAPTLPQHTKIDYQEPSNVIPKQQGNDMLYRVVKAVFHTTWMAVLLGLFIEIVLVVIVSTNGVPESFKPYIADLAQKMSWAYLVCVALTLATVALKFRVPVMGVVGFLAAPLAFVIARALHTGAKYGLGVSPAPSDGTSPVITAAIKAVEYGILGAALAYISKYPWGKALAHLWVGAIVAVLFSGVIVLYSLQAASAAVPTLGIVAKGVSEFIFPIGCALIAFLAQSFGGLLPQQRN